MESMDPRLRGDDRGTWGMERIWRSREKQISAVIENVVGIYGSVEGLAGGQKALGEMEMLDCNR